MKSWIVLLVLLTAPPAMQAEPFWPQAGQTGGTPSKIQQENQPPANQQPANAKGPGEFPEETPEGELSPAALQLDLSKAPPLIQVLYRATRETKEQAILDQLAEAKKLLQDGADVKATDAQGRTALHWAVFGSSYNTKPKVLVAYEEIADTLIAQGVDINREDVYQDTALDYLLYSPEFEMQTLLLEHGATSGFLAGFFNFFQQDERQAQAEQAQAEQAETDAEQAEAEPPAGPRPGPRASGSPIAPPPSPSSPSVTSSRAELVPGATLDVRLDVPVYSDRSRTGDPVRATVTYPLCKTGEQIACKPGELVVAPGTKVNGTILFAQKAPDKYSRPRLVIDFSNVLHQNDERSPLYARVLSVDNARETVRNNEILGIIQPHATSKVALVFSGVAMAHPIAGYTIKGAQAIYGLSIRREILFPAGTDLQIQVVRPSTLKQKEPWAGWPQLPLDADLTRMVQSAPLRTATPNQTPSDLTNLMFIGTLPELITAFGEAGWIEADNLNVKTALKAAQATMRQSGFSDAPVSLLLLEGQPPDLALQKSLNTFAKRHHIRIWKTGYRYKGREVWIGAATHDIATSSSRAKTKWSHRIDPHVDRERDWVATDLLFVGSATAALDVDRPAAPKQTTNATGDNIVTDGKVSVVELKKIE